MLTMSTTYYERYTSPVIEGAVDWINHYTDLGYRPYYVNFMFYPMNGSGETLLRRMGDAIENTFYPRFCTRFARHPKRMAERNRLPLFWLLPDLPVMKNDKPNIR